MPQDSATTLNHKSDAETTPQDLQVILDSPLASEVEAPLVDDGFFEADQPKLPIYKSIPLKAGLAGVVAMFLILPVIVLFSGNLVKKTVNRENTTDSETVAVEETAEEKALRESQLDNANLRRQLALQNQSFTAADMDEDAKNEAGDSTDASNSSAGPATPATTAARSPNASTATRSPASIRTSRPLPPPAPVSRPSAPVRTVAAPSGMTRQPNLGVPQSIVPARASINTAELANNGSYGSLPQNPRGGEFTGPGLSTQTTSGAPTLVASSIPVVVSPTKSNQVQPAQRRTTRPLPKVMQEFDADFVDYATPSAPNQSVELIASTYDEERALIMGEETVVGIEAALPNTIFAGSAAEGQIKTPVSWTANMPALKGSIILTSPLMGRDFEVLPVGTELIVEIAALSQSGAVDLRPVSIVLPDSAAALNLTIPTDAIQILAADGKYPIAQVENGADAALRRIDRQQAVLGALSGAGGFINRPSNESSVIGLGGSAYSWDYNGGSVFAAILEGAANEMLDGRSERLTAQAELLSEAPAIWTLPTGTRLQVLINQEVQL